MKTIKTGELVILSSLDDIESESENWINSALKHHNRGLGNIFEVEYVHLDKDDGDVTYIKIKGLNFLHPVERFTKVTTAINDTKD